MGLGERSGTNSGSKEDPIIVNKVVPADELIQKLDSHLSDLVAVIDKLPRSMQNSPIEKPRSVQATNIATIIGGLLDGTQDLTNKEARSLASKTSYLDSSEEKTRSSDTIKKGLDLGNDLLYNTSSFANKIGSGLLGLITKPLDNLLNASRLQKRKDTRNDILDLYVSKYGAEGATTQDTYVDSSGFPVDSKTPPPSPVLGVQDTTSFASVNQLTYPQAATQPVSPTMSQSSTATVSSPCAFTESYSISLLSLLEEIQKDLVSHLEKLEGSISALDSSSGDLPFALRMQLPLSPASNQDKEYLTDLYQHLDDFLLEPKSTAWNDFLKDTLTDVLDSVEINITSTNVNEEKTSFEFRIALDPGTTAAIISISLAVIAVAASVAYVVTLLRDSISSVLNSIASGITTIIDTYRSILLDTICPIITSIGNAIVSAVNSIVQVFVDLLSGLSNIIIEALSPIVEVLNSFLGIFTTLFDTVIAILQPISSAIVKVFTLLDTIMDKIVSFFQNPVEVLSGVGQVIGNVVHGVGDFVGNVVGGIGSAVKGVSSFVGEKATAIKEFFSDSDSSTKEVYSDTSSSMTSEVSSPGSNTQQVSQLRTSSTDTSTVQNISNNYYYTNAHSVYNAQNSFSTFSTAGA